MTATEELRRMLDEREIEHYDYDPDPRYRRPTSDRKTEWDGASFREWPNGTIRFGAKGTTPAQAIAATVGRSCESCPEMDNPDSYIVHLHRALEVADSGAGTCHAVLDEGYYKGINGVCEGLYCSKCKEPLSRRFKHCPWCGRRIKEESE